VPSQFGTWVPWKAGQNWSVAMSEWMQIAQWQECAKMTRPDIVFEIRNAEGQTMLTPCVIPLPPRPASWKSSAIMFRAVVRPKPQHSAPMPPPKE